VEANMNAIAKKVVANNNDIVTDVNLTASAIERLVYNQFHVGLKSKSPHWHGLGLELFLCLLRVFCHAGGAANRV
ncbi:MAG: hypothetical protein AAF199_02270, partial [Pseudomonadota bacterium]